MDRVDELKLRIELADTQLDLMRVQTQFLGLQYEKLSGIADGMRAELTELTETAEAAVSAEQHPFDSFTPPL